MTSRRVFRWAGCLAGVMLLAGAVASRPLAQTNNPPADSTGSATNTPMGQALQKAGKLFDQQHWAEARDAYDAARDLEPDWSATPVRLAVEGAVACSLKLSLWDDALTRAQELITKTKGKFEEAVGERFLAGLYLTIPHYGTKRGTTFLRGQYTQGVQVRSWRKDSREAIRHFERARELLAGMKSGSTNAARLETEWIEVDFDLAAALTGAGANEYRYGGFWYGWWWEPGLEPEEESAAVEEADYEESRWGGGWGRGWGGGENAATPTGLPLGPNGQPQFMGVPKEYAANLGRGEKIRFLLREIERLDTSSDKNRAARARFRWAMIARSLYGPDSGGSYRVTPVRYDRQGHAVVSQQNTNQPSKQVWELADDETITLVGGKSRLVQLPAEENPLAVLRSLLKDYADSDMTGEAQYTIGLCYQSRQQFPQAIREYRALLETYPQHKRANDARAQIGLIERADVGVGPMGVCLPGERPKLSFTYRNTDQIEFKAISIDLLKYTQDRLEKIPTNSWWEYRQFNQIFQNETYKKYLGAEAARWTAKVTREAGNRAAEGSTEVPLSSPGAYVIEARIPGTQEPSRVLLHITDIALVEKAVNGNGMILVCNAVTGQPLAEKPVRVYEHWSEYNSSKQKSDLYWTVQTLTTDTNGVILYTRKAKHGAQVDATTAGEGGRIAISFFNSFNDSGQVRVETRENGPRYYVVTDRPVYRPGSTVRFSVWLWQLQQGRLTIQSGEKIPVEIYDAKNNSAGHLDLSVDEFGMASGEYTLGEEPPLGIWHLQVMHYNPDGHYAAGGLFRVEEYKKPEFEVSVKPARTQARLGEKIQASIEARYYFGPPVSEGTVSYKIFREDYHHVYWGPGEYDWLYGRGYGRYCYAYPWFPWWGRWGGFICGWDYPVYGKPAYYFPWGYYGEDWSRRYESGTRKALREMVASGQGKLNAQGMLEVTIDTSAAAADLADRDHRYTIEAEVRDASRRTIEGQGSVLDTRQEFYAFVETDGGWYHTRNEAFVEVRTLRPDNVPVSTAGEVQVKRISYRAGSATPEETVVKKWDARTDAEGRLSFRYGIPQEGQYRISFVTRDSSKAEVQGNTVFWVNGPKFDGRIYRFNDLEIIADKRTYKVGETAHLLINTAENNSRILFSDEVSQGVLMSWRFINLPSRTTVIDIPVEAKHVPNFFVEATLVRNGRVQTEARELFVPPVEGLLNVALKTDKAVYQPGETGKVSVAVSDWAGKPVRGRVTLTAYDRAVTYIQDEFGPMPKVFFYGQKRQHSPAVESSVNETFNPSSNLQQPQYNYYQGGEPDGWAGYWKIGADSLKLASNSEVRLAGDAYGFGGMGGYGGGAWTINGSLSAVSGPMGELTRKSQFVFSVSDRLGLAFDEKSAAPEQKSKNYRSSGSPELVEPEVRVDFADTALWVPALTLDAAGQATTTIKFPQSLSTWRVHGYALTDKVQVGDATSEATTTKNLLVRLEAPRFFVERDEVVVSANVHNYLKKTKKVRAELIVPAALFEVLGSADAKSVERKGDELHLFAEASVKANGENRFDWPLRVVQAGMAQITAKALSDEESDGMRLAFPVLVHGISKTVAQSGSYRVAQEGSRTLSLDLPKEIDPEQTRLEVTLSPSLAGVMIDALPYLAGYPYGCVEQTMSRFYPTVLVKDTLKKMGTDLEALGKQRLQMNAGDLTNRFGQWRSPVFDSVELDRMVKAGLERIYGFQRSDGGWGWWREDDSSPYQTAYVLQGLTAARSAGVNVDGGVLERGLNYLQNSTDKELARPKEQRALGDIQTQAYIAYILALSNRLQSMELKKWFAGLYEQRGELNNYGRSLLALALAANKQADEAKTVLRNVLQFVDRDDANETAWVRTPENYWWFWWNNDIESNAWALKALVTIDPQNELAPRLVKWLLNNRRNGYYWRSTRDTALVIGAMTDYMRASGEDAPDYSLMVSIDDKPLKEVHISKTNFFTFDNRVLLHGLQLPAGPHKVTVAKEGAGALYYSAYLSYFTLEEDVKGAGNEIYVERQYFKLVPAPEQVTKVSTRSVVATRPAGESRSDSAGNRTELRDTYKRVPLKNGDAVVSGDRIEVVLRIKARNTYDYLAFEDMKPAGCEPMELRSGGRWAGGLCANLELRDEKVVFFIGLLEQGEHVLRYKLRAETPGRFHALPAKGFAMYAPEVKAISDEMQLRIKE